MGDIRGIWKLQIVWGILTSVSEKCLDGYVPKMLPLPGITAWIEKEIVKQLPAKSITYRLWSDRWGEVGEMEITKLRASLSQVHFSGVPLGAERLSFSEEEDQALQGKPQEVILAALDDKRQREKARREQLEKHQSEVVKAYFNRLGEMGIWPLQTRQDEKELPIPEDKTRPDKPKRGRPQMKCNQDALQRLKDDEQSKVANFYQWKQEYTKETGVNPEQRGKGSKASELYTKNVWKKFTGGN